jgi:hypothetical protein
MYVFIYIGIATTLIINIKGILITGEVAMMMQELIVVVYLRR